MQGEAGSDWSRSLYNGWGGYPVYIDYGGFNSAGNKIEWRIEKTSDVERLIAKILRWRVTANPETNAIDEILVVSKVGWLEKPEACVVGLVRATGDTAANEKARKVADEIAKGFNCGKDQLETIGDVPDFVSGVFGGG